jgi:cell wall-associated NlpC family hydrolase
MIVNWAYRYVGLEYEEGSWGPDKYDCWGLVALIYREILDLDIIGNMEEYHDKHDKLSRFSKYISSWEPVKEPEIGDGILFLIGGKVPHCGVYVGDNKMLHSVDGLSSCIQDINHVKWKSRFEGYYRYSKNTS